MAALALMGLLVVASSAQATLPVGTPPPSGLNGHRDGQEVHLQWLAPDAGQYVYTVYRNGIAIAETTITNHTDLIEVSPPSFYVYHVTASSDGVESPPSGPYDTGPLDGLVPDCELVGISFEPGNPPFVFPTVDDGCKEAWVRWINETINTGGGP